MKHTALRETLATYAMMRENNRQLLEGAQMTMALYPAQVLLQPLNQPSTYLLPALPVLLQTRHLCSLLKSFPCQAVSFLIYEPAFSHRLLLPASQPFAPALPQSTPQWPLFTGQPFGMPGADNTLGNEFSVLSDFLQSLDNRGFQPFTPNALMQDSPQQAQTPLRRENMEIDADLSQAQQSPTAQEYPGQIQMPSPAPVHSPANHTTHTDPTEPLLPAATKTEKFLLTAADQEPGPSYIACYALPTDNRELQELVTKGLPELFMQSMKLAC